MNLTEKQWAIVEWLRTKLIAEVVGGAHADKSEIKSFDIRAVDRGGIMVAIEIGRVKDEGTMAAILCRERFHYWITKRGACRRLDSHVMWKGHPARTYYKARTKDESKALAKLRRDSKKNLRTIAS